MSIFLQSCHPTAGTKREMVCFHQWRHFLEMILCLENSNEGAVAVDSSLLFSSSDDDDDDDCNITVKRRQYRGNPVLFYKHHDVKSLSYASVCKHVIWWTLY